MIKKYLNEKNIYSFNRLVFYSTLFLTNNIFAEIKVTGSGGIHNWNDFEKFYSYSVQN